MKMIGEEWQLLKSELTSEQQADGMRCFYCGCLNMLARIVELNPDVDEVRAEMLVWLSEIQAVLVLPNNDLK